MKQTYHFIQNDLLQFVIKSGHELFDQNELSGLPVETALQVIGVKHDEVFVLMQWVDGWQVFHWKNEYSTHQIKMLSMKKNFEMPHIEIEKMNLLLFE